MEEKEQLILNFMKEDIYVPMKAKELALMLSVPKTEYATFIEVLNHLEQEYKIQKNRKSKYSLVEEGKYLSGVFRANEKGFGFVKVESKEEEIYIAKKNTKGALNGDKVLLEMIKTSKENTQEEHEEGKIIKIISHDKNCLVGTFTKQQNYGFVVPDDRKFGTDIYISKKNMQKAKNNTKVVVQITKYPEKGKSAEGKIIEVLGNVNEAGVDMLSLIKEYNLPYEFPKKVIEEAQSIKEEIAKKDIPNRLDLRDEEIFTIDGEDAKDLDDAVQVKKLQNGNYLLGVHIADVSYYVKEDSALDKEALVRGTSIYMLDRVIPMLPKELSNGICSLNEGKDRFCLSVIMEINAQGEVVSSDVQKSVIKVTRRMNYSDVAILLKYAKKEKQEEAEIKDAKKAKERIKTLEKELEVVKKYKPFMEHFQRMEELAHILKNRREKQGSLNLDLPETKIVLDENGFAIDVKKYEITFANEIIEQFMLTANETIAERFYWLEAPFIYRVHEVPDQEKIDELNKFLFNLGYKIKANKDNIHPKAFAEVLDAIVGKPEERVVSTLLLRTLKVARYESQNKGHFGIASNYYCHFTSPIRRYPDLFIHRMISYYLAQNYDVTEDWKEEYRAKATNFAEQSSEREKIAQKVERDSVDIKKAEYMQDKIGKEYEGIVSSVTSFGMFVELENTVEGLIRFEDLGDDYFIYDENKKTLLGERTKKQYQIGDKVRIRVKNANKALRQVDFALVKETDVTDDDLIEM